MDSVEYVLRIILRARDELTEKLVAARAELEALAGTSGRSRPKIDALADSTGRAANETDRLGRSSRNAAQHIERSTKAVENAARGEDRLATAAEKSAHHVEEAAVAKDKLTTSTKKSSESGAEEVKRLNKLNETLTDHNKTLSDLRKKRDADTISVKNYLSQLKQLEDTVAKLTRRQPLGSNERNAAFKVLESIRGETAAIKTREDAVKKAAETRVKEQADIAKEIKARNDLIYSLNRTTQKIEDLARAKRIDGKLTDEQITKLERYKARLNAIARSPHFNEDSRQFRDVLRQATGGLGQIDELRTADKDLRNVERESQKLSATNRKLSDSATKAFTDYRRFSASLKETGRLTQTEGADLRNYINRLEGMRRALRDAGLGGSAAFHMISRAANDARGALDRVEGANRRAGGSTRNNIEPTNLLAKGLFKVANSARNSANNVALVDNRLRGLIVIAVIAFFQQVVSGLIALGGELVNVASSAIMAAGALGGTFLAAMAQAVPVIGILAGAFHRVSQTMNAVQQLSKAQQQDSVKAQQHNKRLADSTSQVANAHDTLKGAMEQVAQAHDRLRGAQDNVVQSQQRLAQAQRDLTQARRDAARQLQDLIFQERDAALAARGAALSQQDAQQALQDALVSGDVSQLPNLELQRDQARQSVIESRVGAQRAREDAGIGRRRGVEGDPQVVSARQQIADAQKGIIDAERGVRNARRGIDDANRALAQAHRGVAGAQRAATQAGQGVYSATAALQYLLKNLDPAEKRLYEALTRIQHTYKKNFRAVTDSIVDSITYAVNRGNDLLGDPRIIRSAQRLSDRIAKAFRDITDSFTDARTVNQFLDFSDNARKNIGPLEDMAKNIGHAILNLAQDAQPALHRLLQYFDSLSSKFLEFSSDNANNRITRWFNTAEKHFEAWAELARALLGLFSSLLGAAAPSGLRATQELTGTINKATDRIHAHQHEVQQFFEHAHDTAKVIGRILLDIGKSLLSIYDPSSLKALETFLRVTLLPALVQVTRVVGAVTDVLLKFFSLPIVRQGAQLLLFLNLFVGGLRTGAGLVSHMASNLLDMTTKAGNFGKTLYRWIGLASIEASKLAEKLGLSGIAGRISDIGARFSAAGAKADRLKQVEKDIERRAAEQAGLAGTEGAVVKADEVSHLRGIEGIRGPLAPGSIGNPIAVFVTDQIPGRGGPPGGPGRRVAQEAERDLSHLPPPTGSPARFRPPPPGAAAAEGEAAGAAEGAGLAKGLLFKVGGIAAAGYTLFKGFSSAFNDPRNVSDFVEKFGNGLQSGLSTLSFGIIPDPAQQHAEAVAKADEFVASTKRDILSAIDKGHFDEANKKIRGLVGGGIAALGLDNLKHLSQSDVETYQGRLSRIAQNLRIAASHAKTINELTKHGFKIDPQTPGFKQLLGYFDRIDALASKRTKLPWWMDQDTLGHINGLVDDVASHFQNIPKFALTAYRGVDGALKALFDVAGEGSDQTAQQVTKAFRRMQNVTEDALQTTFLTARQKTNLIVGQIKRLPPAAQSEGTAMALHLISAMERAGQMTHKQARTMANNIINQVRRGRNRSLDLMGQLGIGLSDDVINSANAAATGVQALQENLHRALRALGASGKHMSVDFRIRQLGGNPFHPTMFEQNVGPATGGFIGSPGERGQDAVPARLGRGEAVLNWAHQPLVNAALNAQYGFGLTDLFRRRRGFHAGGGSGPGPGLWHGFAGGGYPPRPKTVRGVPGWPGESADYRIIPDLLALLKKWKLTLYDAYGTTPHAPGGEHPLGVAADVGPGPGGSWDLVGKLAAWAGHPGGTHAEASKGLFRWVGWIGDAHHGPPGSSSADGSPHLHLSWKHGPGDPASYVTTIGGAKIAAAGAIPKLRRILVEGPDGAAKEMAQRTVDRVRAAAQRYINREANRLAAAQAESSGSFSIPGGPMHGGVARRIFESAKRLGWNKTGAAGLIGNAMQESTLNPSLTGAAYGLWQWDVKAGNAAILLNHARAAGVPWTSIPFQVTEVANAIGRGGINAMNQAGGPGNAAVWLEQNFEHAGVPMMANRIRYAWDAWRQGFGKGGFAGSYAAGGELPGAHGHPVNIIAHAGEWILNKVQQSRLAQLLGTSPAHLRGMLGFHGGPASFQGGGEIEARATKPKPKPKPHPVPKPDPIVTDYDLLIKEIEKQIHADSRAFKNALNRFNRLHRGKHGHNLGYIETVANSFDDVETVVRGFINTIRTNVTKLGGHTKKAREKARENQNKHINNFVREISQLTRSGGLLDRLGDAFTAMQNSITRSITNATYRITKSGAVVKRLGAVGVAQRTLDGLVKQHDGLVGEKGLIQRSIKDVDKEIAKAKKRHASRAEIQKLENARKGLEQRLSSVNDSIADVMQQQWQAQVDLVGAQVEEINKKASTTTGRLDIFTRIGTALGTLNAQMITSLSNQRITALREQAADLTKKIAEYRAIGDTEDADALQSQVDDLNATIVETASQRIQDVTDYINQQAQRTLGRLDLFGRMSTALGKVGLDSAVNVGGQSLSGGAVFASRQFTLMAQRSQLNDLLTSTRNDPNTSNNTKAINDLSDQIAELDVQLAENSKAYFQARLDDVNNSASFQTGVIDLKSQIVDLNGQISGNTDNAGKLALAQQKATVLQTQGNKLQELYNEAVSKGDVAATQDLTTQLLQNQVAQLENTEAIKQLNGTLIGPQTFSSSAWQEFRTAIFNGLGGIMPQYQIHQAQTGAYVTASGLLHVHGGEEVVPAEVVRQRQGGAEGDTNINITQVKEKVVPSELAAELAFYKSTRSRR